MTTGALAALQGYWRTTGKRLQRSERHFRAAGDQLLECADELDPHIQQQEAATALLRDLAHVYTVDTDQVVLLGLVQRAKELTK